MPSNHLIHETSPYLLQHAGNPVDWHPWGEQALRLSRELNKPILLSIGYSACHWCHVMAHESFENAEVAALMNEHFINIKVDREERPDLDHIYQAAHSMLTGRHGGWPLTMFLTPQQQPFFGGTYFPRQPRYNLPGFTDLLPRVAAFYREHADEIEGQGAELTRAFTRNQPTATESEIDALPLAAAMRGLEASFDAQYGGFGGAPKFPHPADLELCLREAARSGDASLAQMALTTLECMARGGIFDQLGGGFFRYSTDERWEIPHFEKMLYDNAQLLPLYADAWQLTRSPLFKRAAEETAGWLMHEMQSPEGGYYATLDADSEHEEGKFYVWTREEVRAALAPPEYAVCESLYGLDGPPNFEGRWHLRETRSLGEVARHLGHTPEECEKLLADVRAKLFALRERRVRPGRDDKILTSWNGLMIRGMTHAARVFDRPDWLRSARDAANFVRANLWRDGRLLAVYKDGQARLNAYLDDYAFLLDALLELLQAGFSSSDLEWARNLAEVILTQFRDRELGDFFFTALDHETLIHRPKPLHDNATPNGNAVAVRALQRLGCLAGDPRYLDAAHQVLKLYYAAMGGYPGGFATLLTALQEYVTPLRLLVLRGGKDNLPPWLAVLRESGHYGLISIILPEDQPDLPATLDKPCTQEVSAWLCQGSHCLPALHNPDELRILLSNCVNVQQSACVTE
ncbi:MAG: thioredoxin domain-containing protein [Gallionellaceae bacterium]